jgi:LuxR family quorum sensing-dependent transcriptional regulator
MNDLCKTELVVLLEIISECITCDSIGRFFAITSKLENLLQSGCIVFLSSKKNFPSTPVAIQEINVSYPSEWTDIYRSQNYTEVDPLISSGQTGLVYWRDLYNKIPPDQEFYSQAKSFGLVNGFSHIISNQQLFGLMSVADEKLANSPRNRAIINNLAPHFHQLVQFLTHKQARENVPKLTPREREVLLWAMEGKSNWEISIILEISQESIKSHIANILCKLDAKNRAHAVAIALQYDLLIPF